MFHCRKLGRQLRNSVDCWRYHVRFEEKKYEVCNLGVIAAVALTSPALAQSTTTVTTDGAANAVVSATLLADVELLAVPGDWGPSLHSYRYVYSGDDVVFVDPSSRRVLQVID